MKINQVTLFHVKLGLRSPWVTAYGRDDAVETIIVHIRGEGVEGWGESSPLASPCYSSEFARGCYDVLRDWLAPRLLGQDIRSGEALQEWLAPFRGNYFAKAALDAAWWDMAARAADVPLYKMLGGIRDVVSTGDDFGMRDSIEEHVELIGRSIAQGAPRIKLKYGPGWELPMIERVRSEFPNATLHIDCNAAYALDALPMFRDLEDFHLAMIEQPLRFDDLHDHAQLQRQIRTSVCLDESITSPERMRQAIELGSCQWVNIKPGRVGGLTNAVKIHDLCQSAGIPCWVGGMLESSLGAMACAALATLENFKYPADIFPYTKFYTQDLTTAPFAFSTPWQFTLPETPGVGTAPEPKRLREATLQQVTLSA